MLDKEEIDVLNKISITPVNIASLCVLDLDDCRKCIFSGRDKYEEVRKYLGISKIICGVTNDINMIYIRRKAEHVINTLKINLI